jgi:D-amino-acid dehydrogenase
MVDIGDRSLAIDARRIAGLKNQVRRYLPGLNAVAEPQEWTGLRPARPDGKPLIGATPYSNLWINAGHGGLGFTLAAGSAGVLADRIAGRPSLIPDRVFTL